MTPRTRSALLWGAVGLVATLALAGGAVLAGVPTPGWPAVLGAALLAGAGAGAVTYVAEPRLLARGR